MPCSSANRWPTAPSTPPAETAKESAATGKTLRELILEKGLMTEDQLARALDPKRITEPHDPTQR